jgi:hypothetical protein
MPPKWKTKRSKRVVKEASSEGSGRGPTSAGTSIEGALSAMRIGDPYEETNQTTGSSQNTGRVSSAGATFVTQTFTQTFTGNISEHTVSEVVTNLETFDSNNRC